jgi:hypothetical protein
MRLLRSASRSADDRTHGLFPVPASSGRPVFRKLRGPMLGHDFRASGGRSSQPLRDRLGGNHTASGSPEFRRFQTMWRFAATGGWRRKDRRPGTPTSRRSSYPAAARIRVSDGTDEGFTMSACRSMIAPGGRSRHGDTANVLNPATSIAERCPHPRSLFFGLGGAPQGRKLRLRHARRGKTAPAA